MNGQTIELMKIRKNEQMNNRQQEQNKKQMIDDEQLHKNKKERNRLDANFIKYEKLHCKAALAR